MQGKFITFEGIDGSGKSTQLRMLTAYWRANGLDFIATQEPGGTALGGRLRKVFLETEETVAPMAELLLFAADRAQHVEFLIKPAVAEGRIVISDRYADATFAYQGSGRGFGADTVTQVIQLATGGLRPDLTLFFDISVETALSRMHAHDGPERIQNRMDLEEAEFYERVRNSYLGIADREPERFKIIDAERSIDEIQKTVLEVVNDLLGT